MYTGVFTFVRKLGGALGVAAAGLVLEQAGFVRGGAAQEETALTAIRTLASIGPIFFLLLAAWIARSYPMTRTRHADVRAQLDRRSG
jgi:Na+/melibiose symporter-like transporter